MGVSTGAQDSITCILIVLLIQLDMAKRQQADDLKRLQEISYTPTSNFQDDDDAQEADTDFSLEGVANVGSELERMTLQEKNQNMADRLQVSKPTLPLCYHHTSRSALEVSCNGVCRSVCESTLHKHGCRKSCNAFCITTGIGDLPTIRIIIL